MVHPSADLLQRWQARYDRCMAVTPEEAAAGFRRRRQERQKRLDERRHVMEQVALKIVEHIKEKYRPVRIYRWGSLVKPEDFQSFSDIDIAVEGIEDAAEWLRVERDVWDLTDFSVDLVQMEHIEPEYAQIIRQKGQVVYERAD